MDQRFLKQDYEERIAPVKENLVEGNIISKKDLEIFIHFILQDGKDIYFISNSSNDYFSTSGIFKYDIATKEIEPVKMGIRSTFSFIPGTNKIVYAKLESKESKME